LKWDLGRKGGSDGWLADGQESPKGVTRSNEGSLGGGITPGGVIGFIQFPSGFSLDINAGVGVEKNKKRP